MSRYYPILKGIFLKKRVIADGVDSYFVKVEGASKLFIQLAIFFLQALNLFGQIKIIAFIVYPVIEVANDKVGGMDKDLALLLVEPNYNKKANPFQKQE